VVRDGGGAGLVGIQDPGGCLSFLCDGLPAEVVVAGGFESAGLGGKFGAVG